MLSEKKLKDVIASKVSKSPTPLVVVPDPVWELFWSPRSEKNTQTGLWRLSQSSHPQRSQTLLSNHITPHFPYINLSKMLMKSKLLITKPYMISASELLSLPLQPMVILTISFQLLFQVLLAVLDSQDSLTPILENWRLTWFHSQDFISSWLDLLHLPQEDLNNTEL